MMGWDISENGFRIVLSPRLPDLIRSNLAVDVDAFLATFGLAGHDIGKWVVHTGGPKILETIERRPRTAGNRPRAVLGLSPSFRQSSSASVLLVLEDLVLQHPPDPGTLGRVARDGTGLLRGDDPRPLVTDGLARSSRRLHGRWRSGRFGGGFGGAPERLEVALADRAQPPIDKACGEGLMPDGVAALGASASDRSHGLPFHGIRFLDGDLGLGRLSRKLMAWVFAAPYCTGCSSSAR